MGAVAFAPADASGQTVYAGTGTFSSWPSTGPAVGIYKSANGGDSWTVTGTGLQGQPIRAIVPLAAPNDQVVLAASRLAADSWGIFRSADGGETFAPPCAPSPLRGRPPVGDQLPVGEGYALIEDPSAPGRVYCAIGGPHSDCRALVFDEAGNLIVANDGGVYRATGPGRDQQAWQHIGVGMRVTEPLGVSYDTLSAVAVSGSSDNGVEYQTAPRSLVWRQLTSEDGGDVDVDNTADGYSWRYYMHFPGGTVATSFTVFRARFDAAGNVLDEGAPLTLADPGSPGIPLTGIGIGDRTTNPVFVTNAVAADRLLLASANVYETVDGGQTAITVIARPAGLGGVARMAYGGRRNGTAAPDVAYCAIGTQIWRREPGEAALTPLASQLGTAATDISTDPYDWSRVAIIENSRVWWSDQAGDTWAECTGNLPGLAADVLGDVNFHNVVIVRAAATSSREVVLVGAYTGLYRTVTAADGASAQWEKIGNLPNAVVQSMQYWPSRAGQPGSDVLVVGLQGRGTWVLADASLHL